MYAKIYFAHYFILLKHLFNFMLRTHFALKYSFQMFFTSYNFINLLSIYKYLVCVRHSPVPGMQRKKKRQNSFPFLPLNQNKHKPMSNKVPHSQGRETEQVSGGPRIEVTFIHNGQTSDTEEIDLPP